MLVTLPPPLLLLTTAFWALQRRASRAFVVGSGNAAAAAVGGRLRADPDRPERRGRRGSTGEASLLTRSPTPPRPAGYVSKTLAPVNLSCLPGAAGRAALVDVAGSAAVLLAVTGSRARTRAPAPPARRLALVRGDPRAGDRLVGSTSPSPTAAYLPHPGCSRPAWEGRDLARGPRVALRRRPRLSWFSRC
jgi:hypothetical protein